ncbi:hypothetical protein C1645_827787 [Glomus cerebriforme]|uniref:Uncharacterized protein n=1 Tax=Glomus cerebriforme TaxID=658196 RepID=A0A397STT0_9GLOM|nr:hypothetical protein C1645_827787 [Glomus cerebriforme]
MVWYAALMLLSSNAKFHIALVSQCWYTNALIMEGNSMQLSKPVILLAISNDEFGTFEYIMKTDFSYLENIHGCYVFTKEQLQQVE